MLARSDCAGHLYVLSDDGNTLHVLFPSPFMYGGCSWIAPNQVKQVPEGRMFRFDPEPSTQHVWLALSRQPVPELEALRKWVNPVDRGTISDAGIAARVRVRLANGSRAVVSRAAGTEVTFGSRQPMYAGKIEIQTEIR